MDKCFVQTYAKLCVKLGVLKSDVDDKRTFISTLSTRCKEIFDKYCNFKELEITNNSERDVTTKEKYISENSLLIDIDAKLDKTKVINQVTFIGHLYNFGILKRSAIDYCVEKLIVTATINYSVEIAILLIKTILQKYIKENITNMKKYFGQLEQRVDKCQSFRDKVLIQNLIEKNKI